MLDSEFVKFIESNKGCAVIMAGSGSDDKPKKDGKSSHIEKIAVSLESYDIPYEVRICSAHKQPDQLRAIIYEYNSVIGSIAYIAVAGGTDALSGVLSYLAFGPVISCPPDAPNETCLTNPPGSSNMYVARPENAGRAVAQIFSGVNRVTRAKLAGTMQNKVNSLIEEGNSIRTKYRARQNWGK